MNKLRWARLATGAAAVATLAGCSSIGVGMSVPLGRAAGVGVSVGSDGRLGLGLGVGRGGVNVGVGGSVFKLAYHHTRVRLGDLAMRVLGRAGLALDDPLALSKAGLDHVDERLYALSLSIAAGTEQIQRNIVGERMLGLPKER